MASGVKIGVSVTKDNVDRMLNEINALTKTRVLVGIPAAEDARDPKDGDAIGNAALLYIHETGSPAANIPARPTLRPGIEAYKPRAIQRLKIAAKAAIDTATAVSTGPKDVRRVSPIGSVRSGSTLAKAVLDQFNAIGLEAVVSVKKQFTDGNLTPLKPATIAARKRDGFQGEKPLIRTSDLMRHINYVLRKVK
jgi:hypothetical protein